MGTSQRGYSPIPSIMVENRKPSEASRVSELVEDIGSSVNNLKDEGYLIRPSSLSPKPSPLIDERKLNMQKKQQQQQQRGEPLGADNSELFTDSTTKRGGRLVKDGNNRIPIIYMDDSESDEEQTATDKTTSENTERNKNIPSFEIVSDEGHPIIETETTYSGGLEPPVVAVKGTVV